MLVCSHKSGLLLVLEIFSWRPDGPKATSFALQFCEENSGLSYPYSM